MRIFTGVLAIAAMTFGLGCSPSVEAPPPVAEPAPTASAGEKIEEMDFESGEVESPAPEETESETGGSSE